MQAGIVYDPADYRWSSHRAYLGLEHIEWLTTDFGLAFFGRDVDHARAEYLKCKRSAVAHGSSLSIQYDRAMAAVAARISLR